MWDIEFAVKDLRHEVWGFGFWVWGLKFEVWGLGSDV